MFLELVKLAAAEGLEKDAGSAEAIPWLAKLIPNGWPLKNQTLADLASLGSAHSRAIRGLSTRPAAIIKYRDMLLNKMPELLKSKGDISEAFRLIQSGNAAHYMAGRPSPANSGVRNAVRSIGDLDFTPGYWKELATKIWGLS